MSDKYERFNNKMAKKRFFTITGAVFKVLVALAFLYLFVVSLGILSSAFQVLGGAELNGLLSKYQG